MTSVVARRLMNSLTAADAEIDCLGQGHTLLQQLQITKLKSSIDIYVAPVHR